jgi:hypothetical protein
MVGHNPADCVGKVHRAPANQVTLGLKVPIQTATAWAKAHGGMCAGVRVCVQGRVRGEGLAAMSASYLCDG